MDDIDILAKVSLFALMKPRDLKRLSRISDHHAYEKGEIIVKEGARDGRLFVIISGEVQVVKNLGEPAQRSVRLLGAGTYFGEMALIDNYVRTASVVAKTAAELLSLDQWNFREEIKKYPSVAIELLQTLSRRIRSIENSEDQTTLS